MTPKEKAEELIIKYLTESSKNNYNMSYTIAKQCALIAVDEILKCCIGSHEYYWQEVKQEIEKL
jgi:hypothetical protein